MTSNKKRGTRTGVVVIQRSFCHIVICSTVIFLLQQQQQQKSTVKYVNAFTFLSQSYHYRQQKQQQCYDNNKYLITRQQQQQQQQRNFVRSVTSLASGKATTSLIDDDDNDQNEKQQLQPQQEEQIDIYDTWTQERKDTLLQVLLRDLQIEGVPLLSVECNDIVTIHAALWTTVAELYTEVLYTANNDNNDKNTNNDTSNNTDDNDDTAGSSTKSNKVCLIFESNTAISINTLRTIINEYNELKKSTTTISELQFVSLSLLGKGIGPAIIIEVSTTSTTDTSKLFDLQDNDDTTTGAITNPNKEYQILASMKMFTNRIIIDNNIYNNNNNNNDNNIVYRTSTSVITCTLFYILSKFWICLCEMSSIESTETIVYGIPYCTSHERFIAITQIISKLFCSNTKTGTNIASLYELQYYYPSYTRSLITTYGNNDKTNNPVAVYGHIPPCESILDIVRESKTNDNSFTITASSSELLNNSDDDDTIIEIVNYQRRSPIMLIVINRLLFLSTKTIENNNENDNIVYFNIAKNQSVPISKIVLQQQYVQTIQKLYTIGIDQLQEQLQNEINIIV